MEPAQRTRGTHQRDVIISRHAKRQHGVFTRSQAIEAGFSASAISRRRASKVWETVDFGAYRFAGTPSSLKQRLMAACLLGPAVASHRSAALLWELPGMPAEIIEVTALRHQRRRQADITWHESYHLTERDVTQIDGIPVTRPVRTFLDLAVVLSAPALEEILDDGRRRNLLEIAPIWRRLEELGDLRPGTKRVRSVLESQLDSDRPADSVLETRFRQLLREAGVPIPTPQFEIGMNTRRRESTSRIRTSNSRSNSTAPRITRVRKRSGVIETERTDSWRSAGEFSASPGKTCATTPKQC